MSVDSRVLELLERWEEARERGQAITPQELCAGCPELLPTFSRHIADLEELGRLVETTREDDLGDQAAVLPAVTGYQILGILGRGGMGIVYKARQLSLKRLVALKMILAGAHAGREQRARFIAEAEAVARLQHANIVQIHEIGEQDGCPFFSLEYMDGGSLAKAVGGGQWAVGSKEACTHSARLLATLARAVHYAHQRGIVHRDLKPANILLQNQFTAESAENAKRSGDTSKPTNATSSALSAFSAVNLVPKITDFGLAKHLDEEGMHTRSGAVLGTPSYMAPEQAAGRTKDIGPATDVYALGAILYELLTGRPPFRGDTVVETLDQVRNQPPMPPRRVQPRTPRDLEIICLKALAKEPERRYGSALALAHDLECFEAGETITARPESFAYRFIRRVRRNKLTHAAALVATLAVVAFVLFYWKYASTRRIEAVVQGINQRLESADWTIGEADRVAIQVRETDALIAELDGLSADRAAAARQRLSQRLRDLIREALRQPNLSLAAVERVRGVNALLAERDPELGRELDREIDLRLRGWEQVKRLEPPFADGDQVFNPGLVRLESSGLVSTAPPSADVATTVIPTRLPSQGNVRIEALFDASWESASQVGLLINARERGSYEFLVRTPKPRPPSRADAPPQKSTSFTAARQVQSAISVQIMRGGQVLRERKMDAEALFANSSETRTLRLEASREGDLLTFQVNNLEPLGFRDAFPLSGADPGVLGVHWPTGARLVRLVVSRQALPVAPSPLERGDDLFARGRFDDALSQYQQQAIASATTAESGQEARYKQALCLIELNRSKEAVQMLERLAAEGRTQRPTTEQAADAVDDQRRWPLLANCRLWLFHLRGGRGERADDVFQDLLSSGYTFHQLAVLIPEDVRAGIVGRYTLEAAGMNLLRTTPRRIENLKRLLEVEDLFGVDGVTRIYTRWSLLRALRAAGRRDDAVLAVESYLREWPGLPLFVEEYSWLLRERGESRRALEAANAILLVPAGPSKGTLHVLLERARVQIALSDWKQAEADVAEYLRLVDKDALYHHVTAAYLLQGFLREQRGDQAGAVAAWRGIRGVEARRFFTVSSLTPASTGMPLLNTLILGSLSKELSDAEVEALVAGALGSLVGGSPHVDLFKKGLTQVLSPALFREMWQTPQGREAARKIAFQSVSFREFVQLPLLLTYDQVLHRGALPDKPSAEQEAAGRQLGNDLFSAYQEGKITETHAFQIVLAWKGASLSWTLTGPSLPANVRGPAAYFFGLRALKQNQPTAAAALFRETLKHAPQEPVRRLAQAELGRMKIK